MTIDKHTAREQVEAIRRSGKTNMMDRTIVQRIAYESDFHHLVLFIEEHSAEEYVKLAQDAVDYFEHKDDLEYHVPEKITYEVEI